MTCRLHINALVRRFYEKLQSLPEIVATLIHLYETIAQFLLVHPSTSTQLLELSASLIRLFGSARYRSIEEVLNKNRPLLL